MRFTLIISLFFFLSQISFSQETESESIPVNAYHGKNNGREGFYSGSTWIIPPIYDKLNKELSDFMVAKKGGKYGVINWHNEIVLPFEFDEIWRISSSYENGKATYTDYYKLVKNKLTGVCDATGRITIPIEYDKFQRMSNKPLLYNIKSDGKYGVVSLDGKEIFPKVYEKPIRDIGGGRYLVKKDGIFGVFNDSHKPILPLVFEDFEQKENLFLAKKNGKYGILDKKFQTVLDYSYDRVFIKRNRNIEIIDDDKWGLLNSKFKEAIAPKYARLYFLGDKYYLINETSTSQNAEGNGVIDTLGKIILDLKYGKIRKGPGQTLFAKELGAQKYSLFNKKGKEIIGSTFYDIKYLNNEVYAVNKDRKGQYALIDNKGNLITDYLYETIKVSGKSKKSDGIIIVKKGNSQGTINFDGTENDNFKELKVKQNPTDQRAEAKKQTLKLLAGEWYGQTTIKGQEYLTKILIGDYSAERIIYINENDKECKITQYFEPTFLLGGLYTKFVSRHYISSCESLPSIFNVNENHFFTQQKINLESNRQKVTLKDFVKKSSARSKLDDRATIENLFQLKKTAEDFQSKIEERPGGISKAIVEVNPKTMEVIMHSYSTEILGTIDLNKGGYVFKPKDWVNTDNYFLSGVLRGVKYLDENGKEKTGDLDICFSATSSPSYSFKELAK